MEAKKYMPGKCLRYVKKNGEMIALALLLLVATLMYDNFLTWGNISNVLRQVSMSGLISVGMTLVILTGGIDLSVGSVTAVCGILAAYFSHNPLLAILIPILAGLVFGALNGAIISYLKIVPFIATLATQMALRGIAYLLTGLNSVPVAEDSALFYFLGRGRVFGVPIQVIIMLLGFALMILVTRCTSFGRSIFAIGGNEDAARMIGLKVDLHKIFCYVITGFYCALAGILLTARVNAGQPSAAKGWEMDVVAYVAIGGTLLTGGVGGVGKTFVGMLIIGFIGNIINLNGSLSSYWQSIITGLVIMAAIAVQSVVGRKTASAA